jgi:ribokinase
VVVGSLNLDYIASVTRLPRPGETVPAQHLLQRFGGKGANQAVAAARQGAAVSLIGCVGDDDGGRAYRARLKGEGIEVSGLSIASRALTGTALIAVEQTAENLIIVAPEANGQLKPAAVREQESRLRAAALVLLQLEIPLPTVLFTIRLANRYGVPVVLNPSPLRPDFPWGKVKLDTLIVNAGEAQEVFGREVPARSSELSTWSGMLEERGVKNLIITRGAEPTLALNADELFEVPVLKVKPVDTVGAGDAFAGALAARRAEGLDLRTAIGYANCAGALATLKAGAQEAIPDRSATEKVFQRLANQAA